MLLASGAVFWREILFDGEVALEDSIMGGEKSTDNVTGLLFFPCRRVEHAWHIVTVMGLSNVQAEQAHS